jgi:hypothetical protein
MRTAVPMRQPRAGQQAANLVDNAIKYGGAASGRGRVKARRRPPKWRRNEATSC